MGPYTAPFKPPTKEHPMKWTPFTSILDLEVGTLVRHRDRGILGGDHLVVAANFGRRATAVAIVEITNPPEWEILRPTKEEPTP